MGDARRCSVHAEWIALKWTPKTRSFSPAGTMSMNACRDTRGRTHSQNATFSRLMKASDCRRTDR